MKCSVFLAASLDGFIAGEDDSLDWLSVAGRTSDEGSAEDRDDHGYGAFISTVDALVMGRRTYEKVLTFSAWPYDELPVFVLTGRPEAMPPPAISTVEILSGPPEEVVAELERRGFRSLYVDGGVTIQRFLDAGLIQRLIISRIPVILGKGIPLLGPTSRSMALHPVATPSSSSRLIQTEYRVQYDGAR